MQDQIWNPTDTSPAPGSTECATTQGIVLHVDGLEFHASSTSDEPRVLDLKVAERLGYARPGKVRDLIKSLINQGILNDSDFFPAAGRVRVGFGDRMITEYWLAETGALKVAARSDTPQAIAMLDRIVRVYVEAKRLLARPLPSTPALDAESLRILRDGMQRVSEFPQQRRQLADKIAFVAWKVERHRQAVAGEVRRLCKTGSEYAVMVDRLPLVLDHLDALGDRRLLLPSRRRPPRLKNVAQSAGIPTARGARRGVIGICRAAG